MSSLLGRLREELGFLRGNLLVLMVSYMVFGFTSGLFGPFRSPYIRELGASPLVLGLMTSVGYVILAFMAARGFNQMALVNMAFMVSTAFFFPALNALRADIIPRDRRGRILGLMGTLRSLAMVPAATVFGYLYEVNRAYPYYIGVVIEIVTVAIIITLVAEPAEPEK